MSQFYNKGPDFCEIWDFKKIYSWHEKKKGWYCEICLFTKCFQWNKSFYFLNCDYMRKICDLSLKRN